MAKLTDGQKMKTEEKMVQRLGDGQCVCEKHWASEYPDNPEPVNNWTLGVCDYCERESTQ